MGLLTWIRGSRKKKAPRLDLEADRRYREAMIKQARLRQRVAALKARVDAVGD